MRIRFASWIGYGPGVWMLLLGAGLIIALFLTSLAEAQEVIRSRLEKGEIIVAAQEEPGSSLKRVEMTGIIDAPPETVWQIITDVNNFKFFMPRTLNSMAVDADKMDMLMQKWPSRAEEVEKLLGPTAANPADYRIPGGKYTVYHYSNLELPWPCSNRWYILKGLQDETRAAQHFYRNSWSLVMGNLRENSGEWILEPHGANQTKAIYRLSTDPGGGIPGFLVKEGTCNTIPQIIKAVRERAMKLRLK